MQSASQEAVTGVGPLQGIEVENLSCPGVAKAWEKKRQGRAALQDWEFLAASEKEQKGMMPDSGSPSEPSCWEHSWDPCQQLMMQWPCAGLEPALLCCCCCVCPSCHLLCHSALHHHHHQTSTLAQHQQVQCQAYHQACHQEQHLTYHQVWHQVLKQAHHHCQETACPSVYAAV